MRYDGDTRDRSIWRQFQEDDTQFFCAQTQTGGEAIDLYAADTMIFYSTGFSLIDYTQARERLTHMGRKRGVWALHVGAEKTIDNYVSKVLKRKGNVASGVLDDYRKRRH
jgi:SNF2 family DNA or RNA helicase